jgi:EAL domain-containing protein (putative c-di-GMP-specific phosphodiesterase class I)
VAEWQRGDVATAVLQTADAALARAELRGHGSHEVVAAGSRAPAAVGGEEQWRRSLEQALVQEQVELGSYPLVNAVGHLVHQECPLRVGLGEHGAMVPAAVWLPLAVRTGMVARIDRVAAAMALTAIDDDGAQRGINVALVSLQDPTFVPGLRALAEEHPDAAPRLSIDVDESVLALGMPALAELCHQLRPLGVRVGIEHAGERAAQAQALLAVGLDYVKLRASFVNGVAGDSAQAALVRGTLAVFHGLGLMVYAEGVQQQQDLQALWMLGVDGVTGPVLAAA